MELSALAVLVLFGVCGFAAIFFTTFGTLIILVGALLYAVMTGFTIVSWQTLLVLGILYLCGEALEYLFTILGAKRLGASNAAVVGALVGGVVGAIVGIGVFGVGLVLGTILGIFFGAFFVELLVKRDLRQSLKAGVGGLLGRFGAILAKVVIAIGMFALLFVQIHTRW